MKLSALEQVNRLVQARVTAVAALDAAESGKVQIWLGGQLQNDAMHATAIVAIAAELRGRIASLDRDLASLGVNPSS